MTHFKKHRRKQIAELRTVTEDDIERFSKDGKLKFTTEDGEEIVVSISKEDIEQNHSPKIGDMIARNPKNHNDQWLVEKDYYKDNFEVIY